MRYSDEQIEFIKSHYQSINLKELTDLFNHEFGTDKSVNNIRYLCRYNGITKYLSEKKYHRYTQEQNIFLKENFAENTQEELAKKFNDHFGTNLHKRAIYTHCYDNAYIMPKTHRWTDEQIQIIRDNMADKTVKEIAEMIYKQCGVRRSGQSVAGCAAKHKIYKHDYHRYTDAEIQFIKSKTFKYRTIKDMINGFNDKFCENVTEASVKGLMKKENIKFGHNEGQNKKGEMTHSNPIGTERIHNNRVFVKIADDCVAGKRTCVSENPNYKLKKRIVWEKHYGKIPEGTVICHLDKDFTNCDIDNLYLTTQSVLSSAIRYKMLSTNKELTKAGMKYCELVKALKGRK